MRKGRRSAERLSYWPELGTRALTRREQEMPRSFAVNNKSFPMTAEVVISLVLVLLMALTLATRLQAQGPALTTVSGVSYRGRGHAMARVTNSASIAAHQRGGDDGVRGTVREIGLPLPRTSADRETAAWTLLDDSGQGWSGEYQAWSLFLPGGAADIFPGDGLAVNVPSRVASFAAIVREVDVSLADIASESSRYIVRFVDAGDPSLDFAFATALVKQPKVLTPIDVSVVGNVYLADLTGAAVTNVTSTTVTLDAGFTPPAGGGIEVRYSDAGG